MRGLGLLVLPLTKLALPSTLTIIPYPFFPYLPTFSTQVSHTVSVKGSSVSSIHNRKVKANAELSSSASNQPAAGEEEQEENFQLLTAIKTDYNDILIVDTPNSRMLLLDSTYNVHSIVYKEQKWTGSYWDEFASLPAVVPQGPIAIFGLGGGTAAHLMLDLWPSLQLEGWEIDQILIDKARDYLGLSDLEKPTQDGGVVNVYIGDVLTPPSNIYGRYAGIIVDLFSDGKVLPQLQEANTWLELSKQLMPNGRFMVNCGGIDAGPDYRDASNSETSPIDVIWTKNPTMVALSKIYPGQLSWKRMPKESGENYMAMSGPLPDLDSWSASLPSPLNINVKDWKTCVLPS